MCIIGAGYTGLSAALSLVERGIDVVILEANRIADAASGCNGGQIGSGYAIPQHEIASRYGYDTAAQLWQISEMAKAHLNKLISTYKIPCGYIPGNVALATNPKKLHQLIKHVSFVRDRLGYQHYSTHNEIETRAFVNTHLYVGSVLDKGGGHANPRTLALGLAGAAAISGARIFEGTAVTDLQLGQSTTLCLNRGSIVADAVIVACNAYLGRLVPKLAKRIWVADSWQIATEPLTPDTIQTAIRHPSCYWDTSPFVRYFRVTSDNRIVFGAGLGSHSNRPQRLVQAQFNFLFPDLRPVAISNAWSGRFAITRSLLPDVGRLNKRTFYAQGYSGHGIALAILAGSLLAAATLDEGRGLEVFESIPSKPFPNGALLNRMIVRAVASYLGWGDRLTRAWRLSP